MNNATQMSPPNDLNAEMQVLGAVLLDNGKLAEIGDIIRAEDLYRESHRNVFSAMQELAASGEAIDLITLTDKLRVGGKLEKMGGAAGLSQFIEVTPTAVNAAHHAKIVLRCSQLRALAHAASDIQGRAWKGDEDPDALLSETIIRLAEVRRYKSGDIMSCKTMMHAGINEIERRYDLQAAGKIAGIPTGFRELDRKIFGFTPQLYLLGGVSGMGKSALADQFLRAAAEHFLETNAEAGAGGRSAGIISLEMGPEQMALRSISSVSGVPLSRLLAGTIHENDWARLGMASGKLAELPIHYEFSSFSDRAMERTIDHMVQALGVRFLEFDYTQLARVEDHEGTREQEVTKIGRLLKRKVKQHKIPIVAISSLNRGIANRPDKRPVKSDLRETGNLEFDADVIMFIYRDEYYNKCECNKGAECLCGRRGKAELIIDKGRMEGTGVVELEWHTNTTTFMDRRGAEG